MKISPRGRPYAIVVAMLALSAVACTAPAGGATFVPTAPAASVAPSVSPAASGGGKYVDEYATPKP